MKVATILGARPNFIKSMLLSKEFKSRGIDEVVIHTGQHFDKSMSGIFFEDCELKDPKHKIKLSRRGEVNIISELIVKINEILKEEKPDFTFVIGDVNSTAAASIASAKLKIPVVHAEAGLRSDNLYNAEEINRRITDSVSDTLFTVTKRSYNNLIKENYSKDRVFFTGDLEIDSLLFILKKHNMKVKRGNYILVTIHRQENSDNKERLTCIIKALSECGEKVIFPVHPRTQENIKKFNLRALIKNSEIETIDTQGFINFVKLLANSNKVLTDSGGVRREAYVLNKPVIVPLKKEWKMEWFPEMFDLGFAVSVDCNEKKLVEAIKGFEPKGKRPQIFGDGKAHKKIVDLLIKRYSK